MVAKLYALAAVGEGHDAFALRFGDRENVLEDGGGTLAEAATPETRVRGGFGNRWEKQYRTAVLKGVERVKIED